MRIEYPPSNAVVDVLTESGTWEKPAGAAMVQVTLIGGGAGGGRGGLGDPTETNVNYDIQPGVPGAGGAISSATFVGASLPDTVTVTVGAGGTGAPGETITDQTGAGPAVPGSSSTFGDLLRAPGGGGSWSGATAAMGGTGGRLSNAGASNPPTWGDNGASMEAYPLAAGGAGGTTIAASGAVGGTLGTPGPGGGGGGGAHATTGNGGSGGAGGLYGGGGGGGGAAYNGSTSGAGGDGGPGVAVITTYF